MKPEADTVLSQSAYRLLFEIAPSMPAGYGQGTVSLIAVLNLMAAQEYERGAEIRAAENGDMRALFGETVDLVRDVVLREKLKEAALSHDTSLRISDLNAENEKLRSLLIALHAHVEELDGEAARQAERVIWTVLKASAARRLVTLPPM